MAKSLYQQCAQIEVKGAVRDQLQRAALSIDLNLVEGAAKPTARNQRKFYFIALGSFREVEAILDLLDSKTEKQLADKLGSSLVCLIRSRGPG